MDMSKKQEHSFSSVISINPYTREYISGISNFLSKIDNPEYSKNQYAISFLNSKSFIHSQIEISRNIPQEDIYDAVYNKAYDELALDQAVEYKIQIVESFSKIDGENRYFHVFIVDPTELKEIFKNVVKDIKYIDTIVPLPLLIRNLYTKEILEAGGVDCFIYIQENDASLILYHDKEFLYIKTLKYSLKEMHERFCEIHGERSTLEDFKDFLSTTNLKFTSSDYTESLLKLYKELFSNINDVLTYAKRAFEIDKIDNIFIGTSIYLESKLDEMIETELSIKSQLFEFDYGYEVKQGDYVDEIHSLMHLYTTIPADEEYQRANFTIYPRPPKFLQRDSGKILTVTLASLVAAFIYPVTYWTLAYAQSLQIDILTDKYNEIHNIRVTREATIKNKKADREKVLALLNDEKKEFQSKKDTLIKIKDVKNNYIMKAKELTSFTKDLAAYKVNVESILYDENNASKKFTFNLVAPKSIRITNLLKFVTKKYENNYKFDLNKIYFDEKSKVYFSTLKVTKL
jgi:hypothetical protein